MNTTDLFGNEIINEESFEIAYKGSSFDEGKILISDLYLELQSLESLLKDSIDLMIASQKLTKEFKNFKVYIIIEKGSIFEKIKVVFKNKTTIAVIGTFLIPFLNTTYDHFLNGNKNSDKSIFSQEIKTVEQDQRFKNNLKNVLSPLNNNDDNIIINNGVININYSQKEEIVKNLSEPAEDNTLRKNGDFIEGWTGVIRKLDLDASGNNYFGFNIENGPMRIPTSVKGEFNLNDYKEIIDERIHIKAKVKYVDGVIKNIEIEQFELLNKQQKINI